MARERKSSQTRFAFLPREMSLHIGGRYGEAGGKRSGSMMNPAMISQGVRRGAQGVVYQGNVKGVWQGKTEPAMVYRGTVSRNEIENIRMNTKQDAIYGESERGSYLFSNQGSYEHTRYKYVIKIQLKKGMTSADEDALLRAVSSAKSQFKILDGANLTQQGNTLLLSTALFYDSDKQIVASQVVRFINFLRGMGYYATTHIMRARK